VKRFKNLFETRKNKIDADTRTNTETSYPDTTEEVKVSFEVGYLTASFQSQASDGRRNNEFERAWKEVAVA
jgi:hypothetical protein